MQIRLGEKRQTTETHVLLHGNLLAKDQVHISWTRSLEAEVVVPRRGGFAILEKRCLECIRNVG